MRTCTTCQETKNEDQFSWKIKGKQRSSMCKVCHKVYRRQHYLDNRQKYIDKARKWEEDNGGKLFLRYGLTDDAIADMISMYDGKCWLCRKKPAVHIDHDHTCCSSRSQQTCGKCIRGVLCSGCNTGLGLFGDNLEGLERATLYLSSYNKI